MRITTLTDIRVKMKYLLVENFDNFEILLIFLTLPKGSEYDRDLELTQVSESKCLLGYWMFLFSYHQYSRQPALLLRQRLVHL
jgi:hypothetical protein